MHKPKILIFIDWFTPAYKAGGPIKSVSNIVNSLSDVFDFYIITSDRDINDEKPFKNILLNQWVSKKKYTIAYLTEDKRNQFISEVLTEIKFSKFYFNSLFSKEYTLKPIKKINQLKQKSKIILAPRGMLGKGALKIKKLKKKAFLKTTKTLGFFKEITWHTTDSDETEDVKINYGNNVTIFSSPNISILNFDKKEVLKKNKQLKLLFFSRITSKKNLLYALKLLKNANKENLTLDIYGTLEDQDYWLECENYINSHKLSAVYCGELEPKEINSVLSNYHFLLFPTLHENYGHVIVEALTAGCGLIISTNTPWRELKHANVGYDINLKNQNEFDQAIDKLYLLNQEEYNKIRNNCYEYINNEILKQNAVQLTKNMFLQ